MYIEMIIRHFNACVIKFGLYPLHKGKVSGPILGRCNPCPYNIFYAGVGVTVYPHKRLFGVVQKHIRIFNCVKQSLADFFNGRVI